MNQIQVLGKVWKLADYDKDGFLDDEEFALAKHLIKIKLNGDDLPAKLPDHLIPPGQRAGGFQIILFNILFMNISVHHISWLKSRM